MAARVAMAAHGRREPMAGAVLLHVTFTFARPRSHYRAGKSAHLLKPGVPARPAGPPDLSKLVRAVEDALTDAGVWKDDAQVTDTSSRKTYAGTGFGALGGPGAAIAVTEIAALTPG
jgi:Holliday junction resolvase RusA-like endonuclease